MLDAPLQLGDAILGQLVDTLEHLLEHVIPNLHKYLSWDAANNDLGPIIPELSAPTAYPMKADAVVVCHPQALHA
uniref:Uncharacterized protein n=1 Tax=Globisporangium ultimum (strain ATCC 200006 / CBS 805.95 / DAOM BR144) TaxID=431595 RepID=K3WD41_GLOUD